MYLKTTETQRLLYLCVSVSLCFFTLRFELPMIAILTLFIFTVAFAAAAEYAWWGPQRRTRTEVEQRLRGLRIESGSRSLSLLRQQRGSRASFLSRLQLMKGLQA